MEMIELKEQTLKTEQTILKSYDRMNKWNNEQKNKQMKEWIN